MPAPVQKLGNNEVTNGRARVCCFVSTKFMNYEKKKTKKMHLRESTL